MQSNNKDQRVVPGSGPGSSGIENADMDRDMTADAETDKSAEAPGHDPRTESIKNSGADSDNTKDERSPAKD